MYYEYVLLYVDGVVFISDDPLCTMKSIQTIFKLGGDKIEKPDMYLGSQLSRMTNVDGQQCRGMFSDKYGTATVTNVEYLFESRGLMLIPKCVTFLICGNIPEICINGDIKLDGVQWYQ